MKTGHARLAGVKLRRMALKGLRGWALGLVLVTAGCTADQPATTDLTRPDTIPVRLTSVSGTLQPQGVNTHDFSVTTAGEVEVTLLGVALVGVTPSAPVTVGLGIGSTSSGGACLVTHSVNTSGGPRAQITGTGQVGSLCVSVFDVGNLTAPANYTITVASP